MRVNFHVEYCFIEIDETLNVLLYVVVMQAVLLCAPIDLGEVAVQLVENRFVRSLMGVKFDWDPSEAFAEEFYRLHCEIDRCAVSDV